MGVLRQRAIRAGDFAYQAVGVVVVNGDGVQRGAGGFESVQFVVAIIDAHARRVLQEVQISLCALLSGN